MPQEQKEFARFPLFRELFCLIMEYQQEGCSIHCVDEDVRPGLMKLLCLDCFQFQVVSIRCRNAAGKLWPMVGVILATCMMIHVASFLSVRICEVFWPEQHGRNHQVNPESKQ